MTFEIISEEEYAIAKIKPEGLKFPTAGDFESFSSKIILQFLSSEPRSQSLQVLSFEVVRNKSLSGFSSIQIISAVCPSNTLITSFS